MTNEVAIGPSVETLRLERIERRARALHHAVRAVERLEVLMPDETAFTPSPVAPYLTVDDAKGAIDFYLRAFGARELGRQATPDGRILHAALQLNGGLVMLCDDFPEMSEGRRSSPPALGGTAVAIHLTLPDVDATWKRAVEAGAKVVMPLADAFWGDRFGVLEDPFGHRWSLSTPQREVSEEEMGAAVKEMFEKE